MSNYVRITWPATIISTRNSTASVIDNTSSQERTKSYFAMLYYMFDLLPSLWRQGTPNRHTDRQTDRQRKQAGRQAGSIIVIMTAGVRFTQSHQARYARSLVIWQMSIATNFRPAGAAVTKDGHRTWCMNCGRNVRGLGKICICSYHISTDRAIFTLLI